MYHFRSLHFAAQHFASNQFRGIAVTPNPDTHDQFGYWTEYWKKLHKKKKVEPTLEDIVEAVQENPIRALQAVPQVKREFKSVDYDTVANNAKIAEFIARQLLIQFEIQRISDQDEEDAIYMLLLS